LSVATITHYFGIVNPLDKAGAYGIQEGKEIIIDRFEGSFTNIMGLPMEAVREMLEQLADTCALK
jgi:septum formation protein